MLRVFRRVWKHRSKFTYAGHGKIYLPSASLNVVPRIKIGDGGYCTGMNSDGSLNFSAVADKSVGIVLFPDCYLNTNQKV
jgi:hypothetical protein